MSDAIAERCHLQIVATLAVWQRMARAVVARDERIEPAPRRMECLLKERVIMLRVAMLSLICSVTAGVFGFGEGISSSWASAQILFLVFLVFAAAGFLGGVMVRPRGLREARLDDRSCYRRLDRDTQSR